MTQDIFPHGLRVFLKTQAPDGALHQIDFPLGKICALEEPREFPFFVIRDGNQKYLANIAIESVSIILPLQPVGPSDADNKA